MTRDALSKTTEGKRKSYFTFKEVFRFFGMDWTGHGDRGCGIVRVRVIGGRYDERFLCSYVSGVGRNRKVEGSKEDGLYERRRPV